ncbi:response regulator [Pseudodesulfovibrio nedwellii]|uniref:Response regulator n=1 Tax=Pseudodesulfovibrio nedwellii TaxID=2973072 RepID=A0ABN6RYI0_9BACT|nr:MULTISPECIES: response regulator [Pseudodesulfovibrio]BDQ36054.1 response regulator [Pseudodesulfovibrio nedwellii]
MSELSLNTDMRILVVDDSSTMRRILKTSLKDIGLKNVVTADDGDAAWVIVQQDSIDLILSDHKMPNMSGEEFLALVRGDEDYKCIPFIMVTAESFQENVMAAIKLGVSNYIVKPFSAEQLRNKILKVCTIAC